ncbi:MAG: acetyl-CoA carboxylase biotin carboxyl carrier protein subunit [Candidatus Kapabacteria bacterium]|nr:acetyl-CoA carboxylase biotin carboxyl carrier protein subunit [Candidatus Kapabacteria bacterium]
MTINYKNHEYKIELINKDNSTFAILNGSEIQINQQNDFFIQINGNEKVKAYFVLDEKHCYVWIEGNQFTFDLPKNRDDISYTNNSDTLGTGSVKSPMPGNVIKILVEIGQEVKNGDALIIVEAMKMESTLFSTIDGSISKINAKAGQQIDSDFVLIEIE